MRVQSLKARSKSHASSEYTGGSAPRAPSANRIATRGKLLDSVQTMTAAEPDEDEYHFEESECETTESDEEEKPFDFTEPFSRAVDFAQLAAAVLGALRLFMAMTAAGASPKP